MINSSMTPNAMTKKNKRVFLAIWGVALIPLLAATLMYFSNIGVPTGRSNAGELLTAGTSISELGLNIDIQQQFSEPRWLLLITAPKECTEQCQDWLYQLGQIKTALGRDTNRVEYRLVQPSGIALESKAANGKTNSLNASINNVQSLTSSNADYQPAVWVADPLGNLILKYQLTQRPQDLLSDLKKLLKISNIG